MDGTYKVIVVGCGGLGSAALYRHSRELGLEDLPHVNRRDSGNANRST